MVLLKDGRWSSYVWRRGSVPLRWTQTVKSNGVGTAISIEQDNTFRGSRRCAIASDLPRPACTTSLWSVRAVCDHMFRRAVRGLRLQMRDSAHRRQALACVTQKGSCAYRYFRRMQMRYAQMSLPHGEADPSGALTPAQRADSTAFPVAIVNLLRKGSIDRDRSEAKLYSAFCDLMTALSKECGMNIINIGLDWHDLSATHNELAPVVQILWGAAEEHYRSFGFTLGHFAERASIEGACAGDPGSSWGNTLRAFKAQRQRGVFRFNCADSLDRTNVASYYSAFQVST